jgi:hypothetical protein
MKTNILVRMELFIRSLCLVVFAVAVAAAQTNTLPGDPVVTNGKLGIHTSTPTASVEIKSPSVGSNPLLRLIDSMNNANWAFVYVDSDGSLRLISSSGLYPLVIGNNASVPIANPPARLEIQSPSIGTNNLLRFSDSQGAANWVITYLDNDGSLRLSPSSSGYPFYVNAMKTYFAGDVYAGGIKLGPPGSVVQGPPGPQGPQGIQGPPGPFGPASSLQVTSAFKNYTTSTDLQCPIGYVVLLASCDAGGGVVNNDQTTLPPPSGSFNHYLTPGINNATGVHCSLASGQSSQAQLRCGKTQ